MIKEGSLNQKEITDTSVRPRYGGMVQIQDDQINPFTRNNNQWH